MLGSMHGGLDIIIIINYGRLLIEQPSRAPLRHPLPWYSVLRFSFHLCHHQPADIFDLVTQPCLRFASSSVSYNHSCQHVFFKTFASHLMPNKLQRLLFKTSNHRCLKSTFLVTSLFVLFSVQLIASIFNNTIQNYSPLSCLSSSARSFQAHMT